MRRQHFVWLVIFVSLLLSPFASAQFPAAPGTGPGLAETVEAIDSARVTTRILYVTAHPDDESAAVLTYLARGLHADVALLSLTRGEGGQNALGPEQAPQLGLIRTQELLAATRGYGVKLFFTRARDFGFSKTPEESEKVWGDQVTEDMVRVIRYFRPNIVINHWGGVHSGHGHHQASGILTPKTVALAADPNAYPNLRNEGLYPWNGAGLPVQILDLERGSENPKGYVLPLEDVSPLYGKSWRQIGLDAFVNHRTQGIAGFLNSPFLRRPIALAREDGKPFDPDTLAVSLLSAASVKGTCGCDEELKEADRSLEAARAAALRLDWPASVSAIVAAEKSVQRASMLSIPYPVPPDLFEKLDFLRREKQKLDDALRFATGLQIAADADRADVVLGEAFTVNYASRCRTGIACAFAPDTRMDRTQPVERRSSTLGSNAEIIETFAFGKDGPLPGAVQGQVCLDPPSSALRAISGLTPEPASLLQLGRSVHIDDFDFCPWTPVTHTSATSTSVVRVPLRIVPAYTVAVEPAQMVEVLNAQHKPFDLFLRVHSYSTQSANVSAGLDVPDGLTSTAPVELSFTGVGDQYAKLTVTPPVKLEAGHFTITAYAKRGNEKFSTSLEPLPSMPTLLWSEPSQCVVHAFDINVPPGLHVGYISAEGEPIPDALKRLGISVETLDTAALTFGDLSKFNAIVVGVRAYELRPELAETNKRLLDYVSSGGTLVVQYNRDNVWDRLEPAPYPAKIGSPTPRITDENATVTFLKPDDPLLNRPNKITEADFQDWIQERGLYFWSDFDSRYTPLLSMSDPGEKPLNGGLVYTRYGKGTYIYTGLALFRELPEGVLGAYRLFVNLLAASSK
ncbi:MAG TPA: PIG-L family deacetylase [Methylomirabilota bacterium]|nr:PIG-L family deacetylase [Methylomirabilota bacterium]